MKNTTELLQGIKKMRFKEIYCDWERGKIDQIEAARILGVSDRTFRRYLVRYERDGLEGLIDHRIERTSHLRAPVDEVMSLLDHYRGHYLGWNVKNYFNVYKKTGKRSYSWVKNELQSARLVEKQPGKGKHRKRRERSAMEGMMIHQDVELQSFEGCYSSGVRHLSLQTRQRLRPRWLVIVIARITFNNLLPATKCKVSASTIRAFRGSTRSPFDFGSSVSLSTLQLSWRRRAARLAIL